MTQIINPLGFDLVFMNHLKQEHPHLTNTEIVCFTDEVHLLVMDKNIYVPILKQS